jgi:DNA end-binding protein Ku
MEAHGVVRREEEEHEASEGAATNVVDFMSLLQQSIDRNKRTPAKKSAAKKAAGKQEKAAARPAKAAKKAGAKKAPAAKKAPSKAARKRA